MTNIELIRELAKPGNIWMPVITANDVHHIKVQKTHLIQRLKEMGLDKEAYWTFYGDDQNRDGDRWLDVQS